MAKHASARACQVYLQRLSATVLVTVEDNGVGFDMAGTPGNGKERGLGLMSIRERAAKLGGTMRLESTRGKGTRVTVELPACIRQRAETCGRISRARAGRSRRRGT